MLAIFFIKHETAYELRLSLVGSEICDRGRSEPLAVVAENNKNITAIPAAYIAITGLVFLPPKTSTHWIDGGSAKEATGGIELASPGVNAAA